jgi:hypothetical protein
LGFLSEEAALDSHNQRSSSSLWWCMSTLRRSARSSPAAAAKVHPFQGILLMRFGGSARTFRKDVAGLPRTPSMSVETKHSLSREGEATSLQSSSI